MRRQLTIIFCVITALLVVGGAVVTFSGSRSQYVDVYSGRLKVVINRFLIRSVQIKPTAFSQLVREYHLTETKEEWRLANKHNWGALRLFRSKYVSTDYGYAVATCRTFAQAYDMGEIPERKVRENISTLLHHMQSGDVTGMDELVYSAMSASGKSQ